MNISCLVISKTPSLLSKMLLNLQAARQFWETGDEILCSWNGSSEAEKSIEIPKGLNFQISQRRAYHFASNINQLAQKATGELLLLINDDLILDPGTLDRAEQCLKHNQDVGLVGGILRTSANQLGHAGILFDYRGHPYNRLHPELGKQINLKAPELQASGRIPAVTGALMLMRKSDFLAVGMRESFRVCGEDVALCLDLRDKLGKAVYLASDVTGIHDEKSTRGESLDGPDLDAVTALAASKLKTNSELQIELGKWCNRESAALSTLAIQQLDQLNQLHLEIEQLKAIQKEELIKLNQKQEECNILIAANQNLELQLDMIYSSSSWRLTRPLRRLLRRLRGEH